MAVQWLEKNQTDIRSNQWAETIYGVKATNVFGLAWNYYTAYTKFITGLDLTMDVGMKCELFLAGTIKIGYANELETVGNVKTGLTKLKVCIKETYQSMCTSQEELVANRASAVEEENLVAEVRNADVSADDIAGLTSVEEWAVSKLITSPTCLITCTEMAGFVVGANGVGVEPAGVTISGPIIELA